MRITTSLSSEKNWHITRERSPIMPMMMPNAMQNINTPVPRAGRLINVHLVDVSINFFKHLNKSSQRLHTSAKVENLVWTRSPYPYPDYFQNLTGTSLSKDTSVIKFSWKSDHSLRRYKPNWRKMPILQWWRILRKISGSWCVSGWLPKFNQLFLVHRYICGWILMKIRLVVFP